MQPPASLALPGRTRSPAVLPPQPQEPYGRACSPGPAVPEMSRPRDVN